MIKATEVKEKMNAFGKEKLPFVFVVDFEKEDGIFLEDIHNNQNILFKINNFSNIKEENNKYDNEPQLRYYPCDFEDYAQKFQIVHKALLRGDSFLTNLTIKTEIETNISLEEIFIRSNSPFKLLVKDKFVCFSPECFVSIIQGKIHTYPMKGTIDATIKDADKIILNDYKETSEHYTIVDLMRNDLNMVAQDVRVERFRYLDLIQTNKGSIYQVSSEIIAELPKDYNNKIGDIIFTLLPAGSISGAPKESAINIIKHAEKEKRGFYTGVFGYFDGENLYSSVIIRYIEKYNGKTFFRSGGGITINSLAKDEYEESINKIYLPFQ